MDAASRDQWLNELKDRVASYMDTLEQGPGRFLPCVDGLTHEGQEAALGFSCFAAKIHWMLGLWDELDTNRQDAWVEFLKSFQIGEDGGTNTRGAFIDPAMSAYLLRTPNWRTQLRTLFRAQPDYPSWQRAVIAETKQAIATLAEIGEKPRQAYLDVPLTENAVRERLTNLNWSQPWGAGGQASALAVFLKTEAPKLVATKDAEKLLEVCGNFFESIADPSTGAYFTGVPPAYGEMINGAMKVLTGMDWLGLPVQYPEKLIDTCLAQMPTSEGCHLVDAIYVLFICARQTRHQRDNIIKYCLEALDMARKHFNADGGFSYYIGRSQTGYYGVPITTGVPASDIHGTCLLLWAVAMILELSENDTVRYRVIKP